MMQRYPLTAAANAKPMPGANDKLVPRAHTIARTCVSGGRLNQHVTFLQAARALGVLDLPKHRRV